MRMLKKLAAANRKGENSGIYSIEDIKMTEEVKCNQCGESLWKASFSDHPPIPEYLTITYTWGVHSKWKGQIHEFHICQDCYDKMINHFTIKDISYQE